METVDLRGAESAMKRAERTKNAGKDTEKIYFNRLGRFRNQKRIIAKRLPITSQSADNSLKDWKIVIYFYKN